MKRERKARIATLAVLGAALALVGIRQMGWNLPPVRPMPGSREGVQDAPQDVIYSMLDAAREGDVRRYLRAYGGQMEAALNRAVSESGEAAFSTYLRESNAAIKGVAVLEPEALSGREVRVRVEYVYQDRNERQHMYLERTPGGWKISRVDSAERVKTLVPYGTPVE